MAQTKSGSNDKTSNEALRGLPSVSDLIERLSVRLEFASAPQSVLSSTARQIIELHRTKILSGEQCEAPTMYMLESQCAALAGRMLRSPLEPAINATGILLHTGLGRAPMPEAAALAMADVARGYAPVEIDMESGKRGKRSSIVEGLLCELTGAEAATVVNNNAAALLLILSTVAEGRTVIVSRGELIEIGGSFRLPEVIEAGGAILREVGTTNKTKLHDYTRAIDEHTGAILKVHPSNYRIEGFTQGADIEELVSLGQAHELPVIHDVGSGLLSGDLHDAIDRDEPNIRSSVDAGADAVLFSGDKLLGGPQAGIIVGKKNLIARIEQNPLKRALRVDKMTLAGLGVTLQQYRDFDVARRVVPLLAMLDVPLDDLRRRAVVIVSALRETGRVKLAEVRELESYIGGGSVPAHAVASVGIELRVKDVAEDELAHRLRLGDRPVVPRVSGGSIWIDLRTVAAEQDPDLLSALLKSLA